MAGGDQAGTGELRCSLKHYSQAATLLSVHWSSNHAALLIVTLIYSQGLSLHDLIDVTLFTSQCAALGIAFRTHGPFEFHSNHNSELTALEGSRFRNQSAVD